MRKTQFKSKKNLRQTGCLFLDLYGKKHMGLAIRRDRHSRAAHVQLSEISPNSEVSYTTIDYTTVFLSTVF